MGTLMRMGDTTVEMKKRIINWKLIDGGFQAVNYFTPEEYLIYPGIVYHYIANPIQKVLPSVDNLLNFVMPGIYFHPDYFLKVHYNDKKEAYEAEIIKPRGINVKTSTFSIKFISKMWLSKNKYFGTSFTAGQEYVSVWNIYNLSTRDANSIDISWLDDIVEVLNPDDLEIYSANYKTEHERTRVLTKSCFNQFHEELDADADKGDDSVYVNYFSDSEKMIDAVNGIKEEIMIRRDKGKGNGKYFHMKGKGKEQGYDRQDLAPIHQGLRQLLDNECYVIDTGGTLHTWVPPNALSAITLFRSKDKRLDLLTIKKIIDELRSKKDAFESFIKKEEKDQEEERKNHEERSTKTFYKSKPKDSDMSDSSSPSEKPKVTKRKD